MKTTIAIVSSHLRSSIPRTSLRLCFRSSPIRPTIIAVFLALTFAVPAFAIDGGPPSLLPPAWSQVAAESPTPGNGPPTWFEKLPFEPSNRTNDAEFVGNFDIEFPDRVEHGSEALALHDV